MVVAYFFGPPCCTFHLILFDKATSYDTVHASCVTILRSAYKW